VTSEIAIAHNALTGTGHTEAKLSSAIAIGSHRPASSANIPDDMPVHKPETQSEHDAKFRRGLEQFNSREFFDAHESWEEIWLNSPEPHKTFLQGIIQISAAFHHYTYGNMKGTRSLLEAGLRRVGPFPPQYAGIHLELLREAARGWIEALAAGGNPGSEKVPRIDLSADV
jgi:hypothetical protein